MKEVKERGGASMTVELSGGVITVKHSEGGSTLAEWTAETGDWDKIWQVIHALQSGNAVDIKEF